MKNYKLLTYVFDKIVRDPELCKRALDNPTEVFLEHNLPVCNATLVNEHFYMACPELKKHFRAGAAGMPEVDALINCSSPKCIACIAGITTVATAAIVAAMAAFPEDMPLIEALAEICDLDPEVVEKIIEDAVKNGLSVSGVVKKICQALGTC